MANGRMLNKSISVDDRLNTLSQDAMLMYLMAIPHLDRDGLIDGRPRVLWGTVALLRMDLMDRAPGIIQEWVDTGLVVRYHGDRTPVLWFAGFQKNQIGMRYDREPPSRFAPPPGYYRTRAGGLVRIGAEIDENSDAGSLPDDCRQTSGSCRAEDQDQDQVEVEDHGDDECITPTSPTLVMENGGEMQEGGAAPAATSAGDLLLIYSDDELRTAAHQLGSILSLHMDWTMWDRWLATQSPQTIVRLLEWIHYYRNLPEKALTKIESLPAVIRSNLAAGGRPPLTGSQRRGLAVEIEAALYAVREV